MSLLHNKRNRDESINDSSTFKENALYLNQFKNCFDIMKNNEMKLEDNSIYNNKNNVYDSFQKIFKSITSRKDDNNQNNIIMSPLLRSNIKLHSLLKLKNSDKISPNDKSKILFPKCISSIFNNKISPPNSKNKSIFSPFSSFKLAKNFNCDELLNNNTEKFPIKLDFYQNNFSEKKNNLFDLYSDKKINQDNLNVLGIKSSNFFDNKSFSNSNSNKKNMNLQLSVQKNNSRQISNNNDFLGINHINTSLFTSPYKNNNPINKKFKNTNSFSLGKPFQTFNTKLIKKTYKIINNNDTINRIPKPKIFHIEKIFNKKEYRDAHEKEEKEAGINHINRFKISLKKIKQIYINSCLKIYSHFNNNLTFNELNLNDDFYISNIQKKVCEILKSKKISSSKMNQILQVNDDDKYRKHYFMFTSEAKEFCLNLIKIKNLPFDVVMKMCKVPRKSLRRWLFVGSQRKKGCGRKTKNPEMEEKLVEWYNEIVKKNGVYITAKMIRDKAVKISKDKDFLASKGWLEKFKKKFNIQIHTNRNKRFKKKAILDITSNINNNPKTSKSMEENSKMSYEINIIKDNGNGEEKKKEKKEYN